MTPVEVIFLRGALHDSEIKRLLLAAEKVAELEQDLADARKIAHHATQASYILTTEIGRDPDAPYLPGERGSGSAASVDLNMAASYADFMTAYAHRLEAQFIAAECDMRLLEIQMGVGA